MEAAYKLIQVLAVKVKTTLLTWTLQDKSKWLQKNLLLAHLIRFFLTYDLLLESNRFFSSEQKSQCWFCWGKLFLDSCIIEKLHAYVCVQTAVLFSIFSNNLEQLEMWVRFITENIERIFCFSVFTWDSVIGYNIWIQLLGFILYSFISLSIFWFLQWKCVWGGACARVCVCIYIYIPYICVYILQIMHIKIK